MNADREIFRMFWENGLNCRNGLSPIADKAYRMISPQLMEEEKEEIWKGIKTYQKTGLRQEFDNACWGIVQRLWPEKDEYGRQKRTNQEITTN